MFAYIFACGRHKYIYTQLYIPYAKMLKENAKCKNTKNKNKKFQGNVKEFRCVCEKKMRQKVKKKKFKQFLCFCFLYFLFFFAFVASYFSWR